MGRRARINCSPIDSALEKYHNDIGNRLSGVFMPPLPNSDEPSDFGMLTLDIRHRNSLKVKPKESPLAERTEKLTNIQTDAESKSLLSVATYQTKDLPSRSSSPSSMAASNHSSSHSEHDPVSNKEKRGLVDKVTRALFQRKHTCSRCQRKSKSCLPNKNFNGTEKHYMCEDCRESSHAIKHLFTGPSTLQPDSGISSTNSSFSSFSAGKHPASHQLRKQLNDSGYDTVTSCSTVASTYSAFTAPEGQENRTTVPNTIFGYTDSCPHHLNHKTHEQSHQSNDPRIYTKPGAQTLEDNTLTVSTNPHEEPQGLHQFMVSGQHGAVLRQVKTKHNKNYDGYLPDHHHEDAAGVVVVRSHLSDTTNIQNSNDSVPSVKACYTCGTSSKPCFRLPWAGGWLCEDCMDGMY